MTSSNVPNQIATRNEAALAQVHPVLAKRVSGMIGALMVLNINLLVTEGLRTFARQAELYAYGRTTVSNTPCKHNGVALKIGTCNQHPLGATITNAKPGQSWHQFGLAVDVVPDYVAADGAQTLDWNPAHDDWKQMLRVGKAFDLAEGAEWRTFPDFPHLQLKEIPVSPVPNVVMLVDQTTEDLARVWQWADGLVK